MNLCLRWNILSSHRFVPELTFNSTFMALCIALWLDLHYSQKLLVVWPKLLIRTKQVCLTFHRNWKCFLCQIFKLFRYLIWNLNTTLAKYLSKNRDMIGTLSRTSCVLYFVNNRLTRDLDNHLQCAIFLRCYQHIVDAVVVTMQNLHSS